LESLLALGRALGVGWRVRVGNFGVIHPHPWLSQHYPHPPIAALSISLV